MKKLLLKLKIACWLILLTASITLTKAQNFTQYNLTNGSATYVQLNKNNSMNLTGGDEGVSAVTPIGFTFTYNGTNYTDFSVSTNGFLQLGTIPILNSGAYNNDLTNVDFSPVIAPLWDDLDATDSVWSKVTGVAPNRVLTVEWKSVKWNYQSTSNAYAFKLRIFETTNAITFVYGPVGVSSNANATIGLNHSSSDFLSVTPGPGGATPTYSSLVSNNIIDSFPGNGAGYFYSFMPQAIDFIPPYISNIAANPAAICGPVPVDVTVTLTDSASGVSSGLLWYNVNGGTFSSVALVLTSGDSLSGNYQATIPAQIPASVIQYYIQATDTSNNSGNSPTNTISYSSLIVDAGNNQTINTGTSTTLSAAGPGIYDANIKISEVVLYRDGTGATFVYPAYIDIAAQDFIEITNLNTVAVNMGGYSIDIYEGSTLLNTYVIPATLNLDPNAVAVIHLGMGTDDVANNYYNTGSATDYFFSGSMDGFVIKSSNGMVVDAVASNGYVFPALSNVQLSDWSGSVANSSGFAGIIRSGLDDNTATNWSVSNFGNEMTLGSLNPGLIASTNMITYAWNPGGATTVDYITPNLTATTTYTVTVSDGTCTASDSVTVFVINPAAPVAGFYTPTPITYTATNVTLFDTSLMVPSTWKWTITPTTFIYNSGSSAQSQNPVVKFLQMGLYTVKLVVTNASGMDSVTKVDYITVGVSYCNPIYTSGTIFGDYIAGVRLATINNWPTANDSIAYHDYYNSFSTKLLPANTYTIALLNGLFADEYISAWIDYDNNGTFDVAEQLGTVYAADTMQPYNIVFTTPAVITATSARLRIRMVWNNSVVDPCASFGWGETEDYRVDFATCPVEPIVNLGNDTTFCGNPFTFNLDAGNTGASYVWQTGANTQQVTADTSGTYVVDVTYADGCHGRDSISVTGLTIVNPNAVFAQSATNLVVSFTNSSTNATSYLWTFGDGSTSTLATPTYTYSATGQYLVTLYASNQCALDSQQVLITITNTGIANVSLKNNTVLAVPNPSNGQLNLMFELLNTQDMVIEVYNAIGAKVSSVDLGNISGKQNVQMDLTALPKGVYMLKLTSEAINKTQLISIQ